MQGEREGTELAERLFKEERHHRHFDYLKYAVQKEDNVNPDFGSDNSKYNLCEI